MGDLEGISGEAAWVEGRFIPRDAAAVPLGDAGFVLGATVTEQLRTFRGGLFLPEPHRQRLVNSLQAVGLDPGFRADSIMAAAARLVAHNHAELARGLTHPASADLPPDLGMVIFVTAGDQPSQHSGQGGPPRTMIHSFPLAFGLWAAAYERGVPLRSVSVRQVPAECWPLAAKVRSRLHYFLADREAAAAEPGSRAVLAHLDGRISETSTANIAVVRDGRITSPPAGDALSGVSLTFARQLATGLGLPWEERSLAAADLAAADEILLLSTPNCLLPATRFDGHPVRDGQPGPVYRRLLAAWSEAVGLDIVAQARAHAS